MSDNITKRVGLGTAYGFAKAGGYEGTVEEFTELLGNIAIDLARIENLSVTVTTLPAGSQATASLNGSVLSLGIPKGDKGDKGNTGNTGSPAGFGTVSATVDANIGTPSVEVTASGADTAKNFAFAFHNLKGQKGDKGDTGEVSEAELAETLEAYAKTDGSYSDLTAGSAEQLISNVRANDKTPYLFRTSGGSVDIGDREYINGIVGGTVAWNQLVNATSVTVPSGHKYYMVKGGTASIDTSSGSAITGLTSGTDMVIDLTQMFGSTIADYIYSLETANAGAGVAWFRKLFNKPYYAYNAGELLSVSGLVSHDMTGFNQWDEEWEVGGINESNGNNDTANDIIRSKNYIAVVPNTSYYCSYGNANKVYECFFYDADKGYLSYAITNNGLVTTPANCAFMRFRCRSAYGTTYKNDICINLSWDGERNGEYEPYELHSYPLDSDLTLRGIPKLDANNNLYYDGDTYEADGTVTRKYGVKVFDGTTGGWGVYQGAFYQYFMGYAKRANAIDVAISDRLKFVKENAGISTLIDAGRGIFSFRYDQDSIQIYPPDSTIDTSAKLNTWLASNPVTVVYELATPTTETADPYTNPQIVDDFGTEEYVIDSNTFAIPVGHNTDYPINVLSKVEMAPNSPDGDGDYIVRQTNGMNEYVPLVIEDALPTMPSTAGTYKLTVTVADGSDPVLSWEAE